MSMHYVLGEYEGNVFVSQNGNDWVLINEKPTDLDALKSIPLNIKKDHPIDLLGD